MPISRTLDFHKMFLKSSAGSWNSSSSPRALFTMPKNGFKWAPLSECEDRELTRDVYVAIESLRSSACLLTSHLSAWIQKRLLRVPDRGGEWVRSRRSLWTALDVDMEETELLARDLQVSWEGGRLCVLEGADGGGDLVGSLAACLMSV